jgi:hypothetical protein
VQHPASVVVMSGIALDGLIVAAAGLAGGLYNWFAARNSAAQPNHPVSALAAHLLSGVIATATVPLLLDILGNNKIRPTFGSIDFSNINYVSGLAVLVGFCALAGRYSDGFLSGLSSRVLRDVQQEVRAVRVEAEQTSVLTTVLSSKQVENDDQEDRKLSQRDPTDELRNDEMQILSAMENGDFLLRSVDGLRSASGISRERALSALESLSRRSYVLSIPTAKGIRWSLTDRGRVRAAMPDVRGPTQ